MTSAAIYRAVNEKYSAASKSTEHGSYASNIAASFGYTKEDLNGIPKDANLGLSCGNPLVIAGLKESEVVVDLGCGAGFDVFQASKKVGATGKAIGVDMNDVTTVYDMLTKARHNLTQLKTATSNVEFIKASLTNLSPLPNDSVDCIISNCVVNLVPESEKQLAFNEMARVLKPKGRVAISDILLRKDLTPEMKNDMALYVGCVAGASKVVEYEEYLRAAGFKDILITDADKDLNVYKDHWVTTDCTTTTTNTSSTTSSCCAAPPPPLPSHNQPSDPKTGYESGNHTTDSSSNPDQATTRPAAEVDYNKYAGSFKIYAVIA